MLLGIEVIVLALLGYIFARRPTARRWIETMRLVVFFTALITIIVSAVWQPNYWPVLAGAAAIFFGMLGGAVALSHATEGGDCGCDGKKKN